MMYQVGGEEGDSGDRSVMSALAAAADARQPSQLSAQTQPHLILSPPPPPPPPSPEEKVVESGQENTGRWSDDEHKAFLLGLQLHGREWRKVASVVKTRTVMQTRTHAQKYFQKLARGGYLHFSFSFSDYIAMSD